MGNVQSLTSSTSSTLSHRDISSPDVAEALKYYARYEGPIDASVDASSGSSYEVLANSNENLMRLVGIIRQGDLETD